MNCQGCREQFVSCVEELLDPDLHRQVVAHLEECPHCRALAAEHSQLHERLVENGQIFMQEPLEGPVMSRIVREQSFALRRHDMRSRHARYGRIGFGFAAAAAVVVVAFFGFQGLTARPVSAAEVFTQAIKAMQSLQGVYVKLNVRNLPYDNFELIGLDYDFIPIEMWKQYGDPPKWRVEKEGRISVMDGAGTLNWIKPNHAFKHGPADSFNAWLGRLMNVEELLEREMQLAEASGWPMTVTADRGTLIATIEAPPQGDDYSNDYLLNTSIYDAATRRVYRFDEDTELLESLQVFVHADGQSDSTADDVLVFEVAEIQYDPEMDEQVLFKLELPDEVIWFQDPDQLPPDQELQALSPQQVALAFFRACADQSWDEALNFYPTSDISPRMKYYLGELEIISIGTPFQSGTYPGWFVPYEIKLKMGTVKKHNLALRNDNAAKRYLVDGGI